ncbi:unnamed protein product [Closterium sp. NIES-64]|nr:unnamed protein product [Closterium sp. NIES-64]
MLSLPLAALPAPPSLKDVLPPLPSPQLLLSTSLVLRRLALRLLLVEGATTVREKGARVVGVATTVGVAGVAGAGVEEVGAALGVAAMEVDGVVEVAGVVEAAGMVEAAGVVEAAGAVEEVRVELARVEAVVLLHVAVEALGVDSSCHASRTTPPLSSFVSGLSSVVLLGALVAARASASDVPGASESAAALGGSVSAVTGASESATSESLPSLPRLLAPPCLPCVEGRQRAAPHSSEFPLTTAPQQTLHMNMWGPAPVGGTDQERYFMLVVDDYTRYTTVFPLRRKADVTGVLIPWIRATRHQLRERFLRDLPVMRLHSDRSGEFSSGLLEEFFQAEGIR